MKDHLLKSISMFVVTFLLVFPSPVFALDIWSFPNETELKTLVVTNLKSQPKNLWLSGPNMSEETHFEIPAYGHVEIPLVDFQKHGWMRAVAAESKVLSLEIHTSFDQGIYLSPNQTTSWKVRARGNSELVLFNQAPFQQTVRISTPSGVWKEVELAGFGKTRIPVGSVSGQVLSLVGEARISGLLIAGTDSQEWAANPKPFEVPKPVPTARYFRLSDSTNTQSYIMSLDSALQPELISQAERQIQFPWETTYMPRILVARVGFGHGGINRDYSSPWKALWSWHIAEVYRFADFGSQTCDGNPEMLEQTLLSWSPEEQGVICFWNYRVVEELSPEKIQKGK
jgi:hypothetical protein